MAHPSSLAQVLLIILPRVVCTGPQGFELRKVWLIRREACSCRRTQMRVIWGGMVMPYFLLVQCPCAFHTRCARALDIFFKISI